MGVFNYKVLDISKSSLEEQDALLNGLGTNMWKLVSVDNGMAYFARGPEATDQIHPDYGVGPDGKDNKDYILDLENPLTSRVFTSQSSTDGTNPHSHRIRVAVTEDDDVTSFWVETVLDHTHEIKELGLLTKADGHTHTFDVDLGMEPSEND